VIGVIGGNKENKIKQYKIKQYARYKTGI
jgi:hypothetical protein